MPNGAASNVKYGYKDGPLAPKPKGVTTYVTEHAISDYTYQLSPLLEHRMQAYFQQLYSENAEAVYRYCHPVGNTLGHATAITVNLVQITQWKDGVPTEQAKDIAQFTVDYIVLWKSLLHPNAGG